MHHQQQQQSSLFLGLAASAIFVSVIILVLLPLDASSFLITSTTTTTTSTGSTARTATKPTKTIVLNAAADVPSWKDLSSVTQCDSHEQPIAVNGASYSSHPDFGDGTERPTLYRERHGWCPYSERVWLALEVKGIEYDTIYIDNIYGRPR